MFCLSWGTSPRYWELREALFAGLGSFGRFHSTSCSRNPPDAAICATLTSHCHSSHPLQARGSNRERTTPYRVPPSTRNGPAHECGWRSRLRGLRLLRMPYQSATRTVLRNQFVASVSVVAWAGTGLQQSLFSILRPVSMAVTILVADPGVVASPRPSSGQPCRHSRPDAIRRSVHRTKGLSATDSPGQPDALVLCRRRRQRCAEPPRPADAWLDGEIALPAIDRCRTMAA